MPEQAEHMLMACPYRHVLHSAFHPDRGLKEGHSAWSRQNRARQPAVLFLGHERADAGDGSSWHRPGNAGRHAGLLQVRPRREQ